jgi:hypothetical protein
MQDWGNTGGEQKLGRPVYINIFVADDKLVIVIDYKMNARGNRICRAAQFMSETTRWISNKIGTGCPH